MKTQCSRAGCLFVLTTFFWAGCASSSPDGRPADDWWHESAATVREVKGTVQHSADGVEWKGAFAGQGIAQGEQLRTGENSEARVNLGASSGGIVKVMPNSVVIFEQLQPVTESSEVAVVLNLPRGRVQGDTLRMPRGQKVLVKTPNGTHEIEGDSE